MPKNKLQRLQEVFTPDITAVDFAEFDKSINQLKEGLKEKIQIKTIEDVSRQLDKFKSTLDFKNLFIAVNTLETGINQRLLELSGLMNGQLAKLEETLASDDATIVDINTTIKVLYKEINNLNIQKDGEFKLLRNNIDGLHKFSLTAADTLSRIDIEITNLENNTIGQLKEKLDTFIISSADIIEQLRKEFNNRIGHLQLGGGNANRNISIGGNSSVLSRYTDINLKAGSNVTLTYTDNNTTKNLDLTIAATGGGGTVRTINTVIVSSIVAAVAGTDYVILANEGIQLTLPTAVSNTNLYTIKNIGTSSVLINTTASQTIDTASTIIMPVQFTAVDLISDDTNWQIT